MNGSSSFDISSLVHQMSFYPKKRMELFLSMPHDIRAQVLLRVSRRIVAQLLSLLSDEELVVSLEQLDPDKATDLLQLLPFQRQKKILECLTADLRSGVEILTQFDPRTAAGLMNIDYITVDINDKVSDVSERIRAHEKRSGRIPAIIVLLNGVITGYVPAYRLCLALASEAIRKHVKSISTLRHDASKDEVVKIFREHPHDKVVVLGERGNVVGIIYSDDVLRVLDEQQAASLYDFAGVNEEEVVFDTARTKIKLRYKWLIIILPPDF